MILENETATAELGVQLAKALRPADVVTLSGPLGVGKTAMVRAILGALGHEGDVPSPTFAIVQPYEELPLPVWHVDLYRIETTDELAELGLESLTDEVLLVEWPERAGDVWPGALRLSLDFTDGASRRLTADVPPSWQERWPVR
jgi:tRNA threonylcarbamoyladenosine biosynthesis protein TsaE